MSSGIGIRHSSLSTPTYVDFNQGIVHHPGCDGDPFPFIGSMAFACGPTGLCSVSSRRQNVRIFWEDRPGVDGMEATPAPAAMSNAPQLVRIGGDVNDCIWNEIWSPELPWVGAGDEAHLQVKVYRDLPLDNLVFRGWHVRASSNGSWGPWCDQGFVYYGGQKKWDTIDFDVSDGIAAGTTKIQVALGVRDMCYTGCGSVGSGACHSHAPLFDMVSIYRVSHPGPQWSVSLRNLFQDDFPDDGTGTGTVRIDRAEDIDPTAAVVPGDRGAPGRGVRRRDVLRRQRAPDGDAEPGLVEPERWHGARRTCTVSNPRVTEQAASWSC